MAKELTAENFKTEVIDEKTLPVLVDFWASWCGPCRSQAPIFEKFGEENSAKIKACKLNVDDLGDIASQYGVMSIPTIILFRDGKPIKKAVGVQTAEQLKALAGI